MSGRWLTGKVAASLLTLVFVLIFNFFLFRVMGDPTTQLARLPSATPQELEELKADYGLDKPVSGQFVDYIGDTLTLDLGISQRSREDVWDEILDALPWTLLLVGVGTIMATLLGSWMGVIAATRRGKKTDDGLLGFSLFTYAAPEYWIGIILILLFAVAIPIFPAGLQQTPGVEFSGFWAEATDVLDHLILPATAMTLMLLGQYFLIMRSSMVDVLTEDFVTVKRATGLPWSRVVRSHAVPNALLPLVTSGGDPVRGGRRRRDHDRDDLLLAGARRALLPGDRVEGLPCPPGDLPRLLGRRDHRQPARRLPLLLPRPAGEGDMTHDLGCAHGR